MQEEAEQSSLNSEFSDSYLVMHYLSKLRERM